LSNNGQLTEGGLGFISSYTDACLPLARTTRVNVRSASFTAFESGKMAAMSGSRTTRFVPWAYRAAYLPRTPLLKSYSSSKSGSRFLGAFFIILPLPTSCDTSTDDANPLFSVGEDNDQESTAIGLAERYKAILFLRV